MARRSFGNPLAPSLVLESRSSSSIRQPAGSRSILFLHPSDEAYGADRVLLQLVLALRDRQWRVGVLLSEDQPAGWLSQRLQAAGILMDRGPLAPARRRYLTVVALPAYLRALLRARRWVRSRARHFGPDIIHVNTSALLVAAVLGRPASASLVWHIHEIVVEPKLVSWIFRLMPVLVADRVVAISGRVRDHVSPSRFRRTRISVVWNGIEPRDSSARNRVNSTHQRIAFVGRLNRWKGYELFVEAAARLIEEFPSARFVIVGDPPPGEEWRVEDLTRKVDALQLSHQVAHPWLLRRRANAPGGD